MLQYVAVVLTSKILEFGKLYTFIKCNRKYICIKSIRMYTYVCIYIEFFNITNTSLLLFRGFFSVKYNLNFQ